MEPTFATLPLSGCSGCDVNLLNSDEWVGRRRLTYMPLLVSADDLGEVDTLLVTGGVGTEEDEYRLRRGRARARQLIAAGTCAISGGVANIGSRDEVRSIYFSQRERRDVPRLLRKCRPVDDVVPVDLYLPGCPPMPHLFIAALFGRQDFTPAKTVCIECGRRKTRDRPAALRGFQAGEVEPGICLINQGYLCIGSSTRGGCRAPCPRAGHPCVGCRGPSDGFITRSSEEWFDAIQKVFTRLTDIPSEVIDAMVRSPQYALFTFQFADYSGRERDVEKVL